MEVSCEAITSLILLGFFMTVGFTIAYLFQSSMFQSTETVAAASSPPMNPASEYNIMEEWIREYERRLKAQIPSAVSAEYYSMMITTLLDVALVAALLMIFISFTVLIWFILSETFKWSEQMQSQSHISRSSRSRGQGHQGQASHSEIWMIVSQCILSNTRTLISSLMAGLNYMNREFRIILQHSLNTTDSLISSLKAGLNIMYRKLVITLQRILNSTKTLISSATNAKPCSILRYEIQWYYRDDERKFAAYSQADSAKIEHMFQKVSTTPKYLQIQSRIYTFDFENMKQVNVATKYQRDIKREETPMKQSEKANPEAGLPQCIINLRGPFDNIQTAKQRVKNKLESLSAFKHVPLPPTSTPALKQKLCSIVRRHGVSSSIRDDEKAKLSSASNRRLSQVIRIEGAEHLVDKAVTEVQGEIIEFHSKSSSALVAQADTLYPPEWESQTSTNQLFMLGKYSREWIRITSKFKETISEAEILSIQRIQNKWLWERYSQHKDRIRKKNDGVVNEKELWHGSRKSSSDNIYNSEEGFDMRFSSEGLWGQANYFAEKASYSDTYAFKSADGTKELLLARVLTGASFESVPNSSLRMPPEKPSSLKTGNVQLKQLRYDSVSGTTCNCRVYMTYSNDKAYPAYLISYSTTPKPKPSYQLPPHYARHRYKKI